MMLWLGLGLGGSHVQCHYGGRCFSCTFTYWLCKLYL